jgi:hypothetical protein
VWPLSGRAKEGGHCWVDVALMARDDVVSEVLLALTEG